MTEKFSALQLKVKEVNALFTMKQNHSSTDLLGQQGQVHDGAPKHHGEHGLKAGYHAAANIAQFSSASTLQPL